MLLVTFVRNLFADLLPARIGSTVYIVVLRTRFGYPVDAGTSIWALAFLLDMVVMVPLMAIGIAMVGGWRLGVSPMPRRGRRPSSSSPSRSCCTCRPCSARRGGPARGSARRA